MTPATILVLDSSPFKKFGVLEATAKGIADEGGPVGRVSGQFHTKLNIAQDQGHVSQRR
jgi:hypothetical protein